jgi:hypothetical protein
MADMTGYAQALRDAGYTEEQIQAAVTKIGGTIDYIQAGGGSGGAGLPLTGTDILPVQYGGQYYNPSDMSTPLDATNSIEAQQQMADYMRGTYDDSGATLASGDGMEWGFVPGAGGGVTLNGQGLDFGHGAGEYPYGGHIAPVQYEGEYYLPSDMNNPIDEPTYREESQANPVPITTETENYRRWVEYKNAGGEQSWIEWMGADQFNPGPNPEEWRNGIDIWPDFVPEDQQRWGNVDTSWDWSNAGQGGITGVAPTGGGQMPGYQPGYLSPWGGNKEFYHNQFMGLLQDEQRFQREQEMAEAIRQQAAQNPLENQWNWSMAGPAVGSPYTNPEGYTPAGTVPTQNQWSLASQYGFVPGETSNADVIRAMQGLDVFTNNPDYWGGEGDMNLNYGAEFLSGLLQDNPNLETSYNWAQAGSPTNLISQLGVNSPLAPRNQAVMTDLFNNLYTQQPVGPTAPPGYAAPGG